MSRYSTIERRMWRDEKFRALSAPPPNAQTLWSYLLTGPHNTPIPGLFVLGMATIADELGWPLEATKTCFQEITAAGMARFDQATRLIWLPNALRSNKPGNPNVVVGWREEWSLLPDCPLKREATEFFGQFLLQLSSEFARSFAIVLGKAKPRKSNNPSGKPKPKPSPKPLVTLSSQEQEQEQEQEGETAHARDPSAPCVVPLAPEPEPPSPTQEPPAPKTPEPDPPKARCPTIEHEHPFDPAEALLALRDASDGSSRGALGGMASTPQMLELKRLACSANPRPLTIEDFRALGEAWKAKKALSWMTDAPSLGQLLRDNGDMLMTAVEQAVRWKESQQRRVASLRIVAFEPEPEPCEPSPEEARRAREAMNSLRAGRT